jgi:hypothetical protein
MRRPGDDRFADATALVVACLVLAPGLSRGDELFRCGKWLVSADMPVAELLQKCGQPASRKVTTQGVHAYNGALVGVTTIETWRFDRGPRAAAMIVTVIDGKIATVEREGAAPQPADSP